MPDGATRQPSGPLREVRYDYAGPTIRKFHLSNAFARALVGPLGSGKSSACVVEMLWRASEQAPGSDGKRHTRVAVIRNHYPELQTTTVRTFEHWTAGVGQWKRNPPIGYTLQTEDFDLEVIFLALDSEADVAKLLSLELSFAWINEAREVPRPVFDALTARVGRFPAKADGGCTYSGVILDTNPPDTESWIYRLFSAERPAGYELFKQPSGLSPQAENVQNLPADYYQRISAGKSDDWIKVYCHGEFGHLAEGRPIYHNYRDSVHCAPEPLHAVPDVPLILGCDFGLTPAAPICQRLADGRWIVIDEMVAEDTGIVRFGQALSQYVADRYPDHRVESVWADPAGNQRAQTDERTAIELLQEHTGWRVRPAPSNDFTMRREVVLGALGRLIDGRPGLLISPTCRVLRKAMAGGYQYRQSRGGISGPTYTETPLKNEYSHVAEGLQYALLGGGEAGVVMNKVKRRDRSRQPSPNRGLDYDVFDLVEPARKPRREFIDPVAWPCGYVAGR